MSLFKYILSNRINKVCSIIFNNYIIKNNKSYFNYEKLKLYLIFLLNYCFLEGINTTIINICKYLYNNKIIDEYFIINVLILLFIN